MIERLFAAHMFAKHSFGVKYLGTPLRNPSRKVPGGDNLPSPPGVSHPLKRLTPMTAAFAPAPQTTFRPRTVDDPSLTPMQRPVLAIVPARDEAPAEVAPLAAVYRLRVADQANVYRRRRLAALAIVAGLVLGVVSFMQQADATPTPEGQLTESVSVVVQPGDTLWGIASALAPEGDPRALVDQLSDLAGGSQVQPGQQLVVPLHWLD